MPAASLATIIDNDRARIAHVATGVARLMADAGVGPAARYAVELALDELVTNAVCHGYPDGATGRIEVSVSVEAERVTLAIADDGRPYDPLQASDPPIAGPLESRPIGGLGIHLVRSLMDEVRYRRDGDRNIVTCIVARRDDATR